MLNDKIRKALVNHANEKMNLQVQLKLYRGRRIAEIRRRTDLRALTGRIHHNRINRAITSRRVEDDLRMRPRGQRQLRRVEQYLGCDAEIRACGHFKTVEWRS